MSTLPALAGWALLTFPVQAALKRLNISTYQYTAKARYKGSDAFAVKATGKDPTSSGTSVITLNAAIQ